MANRKNQVVGLKTELTAQLRLAEDPNIIVFTPLGGLGPVDIVTLDLTTGEYKAYDVKSKNFRKRKGSLIHRGTTNEQKKLNVKIIYE